VRSYKLSSRRRRKRKGKGGEDNFKHFSISR